MLKIAKRTVGHLGIEYVVVQSSECMQNVVKLKNQILYTAIIVGVIIIFIAVMLSYMFLKPLKDKMQEIENFVKDTSHELMRKSSQTSLLALNNFTIFTHHLLF